jgi:hypothetical protein
MHQNQCGGWALQSRFWGALVERAQAQSRGRSTSESCSARARAAFIPASFWALWTKMRTLKSVKQGRHGYPWRPRPASRQCQLPQRADLRSRNGQPPSDFGHFSPARSAHYFLKCVRPSRQEAALYLRRCAVRDDKQEIYDLPLCQ